MSELERIEAVMDKWERARAMDGPRLISVGRGVVDARHIVGVIAVMDEDIKASAEDTDGSGLPSYARSWVMLDVGKMLSDEPADVVVMRWRQALGGLPDPIGGAPRP